MEENRGEAIEKLKGVQGHLVVLPLGFLKESIDATSLICDRLGITKAMPCKADSEDNTCNAM